MYFLILSCLFGSPFSCNIYIIPYEGNFMECEKQKGNMAYSWLKLHSAEEIKSYKCEANPKLT